MSGSVPLASAAEVFKTVSAAVGGDVEKDRLLAFSDGVIAIIITIMVLELKPPHSADLAALLKLGPLFASYVLSFLYVAIYWNNHHHMMYAVDKVDGTILWANMHLLFWLSLVPFTTGWMGETLFAPLPTAVYGVSLLMPAIAYTVMTRAIIASEVTGPLLQQAIGRDIKGWVSLVCYVAAIPVALYHPWVAGALYLVVALIWLIPDPRIEKKLRS